MINIGDTIETFHVESLIGEGGMGLVYKVINVADGKEYALKYCRESDEYSIRRFKREVKIASETKHQNIIEIIHQNLDNNPPFFIMPLAKGSVHEVIDSIKGDFSKVMIIFEQICKGVSALHLSGKYHRDIKPRNALVHFDGSIVLSDFGLARFIIKDSSSHPSSNSFLGTIGYHAPEQIEAKNSDARTDVFQLGKCFYELITGDYPYLINLKKIPDGLAYIIQRATAIDPDDRYKTVSDLLQALKSYEKSLNPAANPADALENKILEITKLLNSGTYNEEVCLELLDLLGSNRSEIDLFMEYFDKIPNQLLKIFATQFEKRFEPILEAYTKNLETYVRENHLDFSYAEIVASKMTTIFLNTKNATFKGIAIRNTLKAAIYFNRYNAMDSFNYLLQQVKIDSEASLIAQILRDEMDFYSQLSDQSDDNQLHSTIIDVKQEAIKYLEDKEKKRISEHEEFIKNLFK